MPNFDIGSYNQFFGIVTITRSVNNLITGVQTIYSNLPFSVSGVNNPSLVNAIIQYSSSYPYYSCVNITPLDLVTNTTQSGLFIPYYIQTTPDTSNITFNLYRVESDGAINGFGLGDGDSISFYLNIILS
jgi:hypothetical protein